MKELQITKEQKIKLVRLIIDKMSIAELKDLYMLKDIVITLNKKDKITISEKDIKEYIKGEQQWLMKKIELN